MRSMLISQGRFSKLEKRRERRHSSEFMQRMVLMCPVLSLNCTVYPPQWLTYRLLIIMPKSALWNSA